MEEDNVLKILKQAILLERRGKAFYKKIAEQAENSAVKEIFSMMADEEGKHIKTLAAQFKAYSQDKKFAPAVYEDNDVSQVASKVLIQDIKDKITAAGFEAAAISAAIAMEDRAIKLYSESAETAVDPEAKALYKWLTRWEREHLNMLLDIDKEVREKIWFDNSFWRF